MCLLPCSRLKRPSLSGPCPRLNVSTGRLAQDSPQAKSRISRTLGSDTASSIPDALPIPQHRSNLPMPARKATNNEQRVSSRRSRCRCSGTLLRVVVIKIVPKTAAPSDLETGGSIPITHPLSPGASSDAASPTDACPRAFDQSIEWSSRVVSQRTDETDHPSRRARERATGDSEHFDAVGTTPMHTHTHELIATLLQPPIPQNSRPWMVHDK